MRLLFPTAAAVCLLAGQALTAADNCTSNHSSWNNQPTVAESREQHVAAAANTTIDPGVNGGIRIHGWNNQDVLVKACIQASALTEDEANALLKEVKIVRGPGDLQPDGPSSSHSRHWNVSYEIWMPNKSNIEAHGINGGISIESLEGQIRFHTQNGGVNLTDVGGDVEGSTQNGGLTIELKGSSWRGAGLRAETQNGGINMRVPEGYSADFEASTVNGGMHVDFPVQLNGRTLSFNLGSGGAPIRTKTTNGGVHITKG
jgi:DUF4097 and DUF4098 domain-containing protein YvlB